MKLPGKKEVVIAFMFAIVVATFTVIAAYSNGSSQEALVEITSRTEYIPGDEGQVLADVRFATTNQPAPATCYASIVYPNKTVAFTNQEMSTTTLGTHNYTFTVPSVEGVYEYQTRCEFSGRNVTRSKAFHVSSAFGLLTEDIRSQISFLEQGVDEVNYGKNSRNGWKMESSYVTNISDVSCRITPLNTGGAILFEDDFTRTSLEDPPGEPYETFEEAFNSRAGYPNSFIDAGKLTQEHYTIFSSFSAIANDVNLSFIPTRFYGETKVTWQQTSTPSQKTYYSLYFFNSTNDLIGRLYMQQYYSTYNFNNCGGGVTPQYDSCGLYTGCAVETNDTVCLSEVRASNDNALITWNVDVKKQMEAKIDWSDVDRVMFRAASQQRSLDRYFIDYDNVIMLAEPTGDEYIEQNNKNFGIDWVAQRNNSVVPRTNYKVQCGVAYDVDVRGSTTQKLAEGLEQYVYVNEEGRLRAWTTG